MKYVISFFISMSAFSAPIQVYFENGYAHPTMIKQILMADYQIPEELISVKEIKDCSLISGNGKLDLCLKNNGDLLLVSVDREFINESLKIFRAP